MTNTSTIAKIKEELNWTGSFLEQKIHVALDKHGKFVSRREHPYSAMNIINDTIPDIIEGTIDVFSAAKVSEDTALCLCVECKKADPKQKHWVFELRTSGEEIYPFDYYDSNPQVRGLNYQKNIFFDSLGYQGMKYFDKAIQAFEFQDVSGNLSRTQNERVYFALRQANQAIKAFAPEPKTVCELLGESPLNILYLGVVVTTANLWTTEYNPQDVSWSTGELAKDKLNLKEKDWVHYEFPLPVNLKLNKFEKRPTFVVKADKFSAFIEGLLKDLPRRILDWK